MNEAEMTVPKVLMPSGSLFQRRKFSEEHLRNLKDRNDVEVANRTRLPNERDNAVLSVKGLERSADSSGHGVSTHPLRLVMIAGFIAVEDTLQLVFRVNVFDGG